MKRTTILIGPAANDPAESVSVVNRAFMEGLKDKYDFIPLPADRKLGGSSQRSLNLVNGFYFIRQFLFWVWQLIWRRPQIVHYAVTDGWAMEKGFMFMMAGKFFGARAIGHLHSGIFIEHWNAIPPWRQRLGLRVLRSLDAFVVLSEGWRKNMQKTVPLDDTKVFVVNNPIDVTFETAALKMSIERPGTAFLSLGALEKTKGVMDLLEAARRSKDAAKFTLQFVGPERQPGLVNEMNEFIRTHGLDGRASVRGGTWGEEKIRIFEQSNIFVLPSYFENFPLVVLEAAAAGMAIITTPVGAVPEFFEHDVSAIFVEPGNVEQLTAAVQSLASDPERRLRLARAARAVFQRSCARSRIMQSLEDIYRHLTTPN